MLSYKEYTKSNNKNTIIIIHGLFGNATNWNNIAKKLNENFNVMTIDCRNHGNSFHAPSMTHIEMAMDTLKLIDSKHIKAPLVIGHSMGGKIAMTLSLIKPKQIQKQIIVDIAPKNYPPHHESIINALLSVNLDTFNSRSEISSALKSKIPNQALRNFLLKNLSQSKPLKWTINIQSIAKNYKSIMDWPKQFHNQSTKVPTLFIKGTLSNYINEDDYQLIQNTFTNFELMPIKASHWVHTDQSELFVKTVNDFLI